VTEKVGERAKVILEQAFQFGVAKGGDRRSCIQMEEQLANRLPVEERVSRFRIQTWLSSRLTRAKKEKDPNYVRKCAVEATKQQFFNAAWGFNPATKKFTKAMIIDRLFVKHQCAPKTKVYRQGEFLRAWSRQRLLEFLYSKEKVPNGFADIKSFLDGLTLLPKPEP
jgi:hypothetical protein